MSRVLAGYSGTPWQIMLGIVFLNMPDCFSLTTALHCLPMFWAGIDDWTVQGIALLTDLQKLDLGECDAVTDRQVLFLFGIASLE